jgi:mono/diheme cytochrome c family protein/uncharacterized membrane protein
MWLIASASQFEQVIGRLHPLLLHFPLALILVAAAIEAVRYMLGKREVASPAASVCLWIGFLMAIPTVWAGWELAEYGGDTGTLVGLHRWTAIASLVVMALAVGAWIMRRIRGADWAGTHVGILLVAALLVGVAGHFGAEMVWGENWLFGPLTAEQTEESSESAPQQSAGVGWSDVEPIFLAHCQKCHGPKRQKNGLQLVPWPTMFAGTATDQVIDPGNPSSSLLYHAITLPAGEDDHMPPMDEGDPLTDKQIGRIAKWITDGATGPDGQRPPEPSPAAGAGV